jgi:hypothetical protein
MLAEGGVEETWRQYLEFADRNISKTRLWSRTASENCGSIEM